MLGVLCRQQKLKFGRFVDHVHINADATGRCSSAMRRGASLAPVGTDYQPVALTVKPANWLNLLDGRSL